MQSGWRRILPNETSKAGDNVFLNISLWSLFFHKKIDSLVEMRKKTK
jgi:hypothetical protein